MKKLSILSILAARWGLDVIRGYQRVADGREGLAELLGRAPWPASVDAESECLGLFAQARRAPGGLGLGARLAITPQEIEMLALAVNNRRAELNARPGPSEGA